ncbi:MAG: DUF2878 domain-containing protein [Dokdonella sp.]|uniref:DUF2878 domain-containing protein n=1 Tax=Dokdonella sp. TaxID=2291710 RepID=UPI003264624E
MSPRAAFWINTVAFQLVWMVAVGGAAQGLWWAGPIAVCVFAAYQLSVSTEMRSDVLLIILAVVIGAFADSLLAHLQLVRYTSPVPSAEFAPLWILALWASLALTINHSMAFLQRDLRIAALFGALGAPLSFSIADRAWNAVKLAEPLPTTLFALAALWTIATPLLAATARLLRRRATSLTLASALEAHR